MHEGPLLLPSGHVVFTPPPQFDLAAAPDVAYELRALLELHPHVAVDLSSVEFIDSSGLGVLVTCRKLADEWSGELVLCGAASRIERLLQITGLDEVFRRYPDTHSVMPRSAAGSDGSTDTGTVEGVV